MLRAAMATPLGHDVGACLAPPNCPYQEPVRTELIDLRFDCLQLFSRSRSQRRQGFESETLASEEPSGFEPDENWHSSSVEMIAVKSHHMDDISGSRLLAMDLEWRPSDEGRADSVDDLAIQGVAAGGRALTECGWNLPTFRDLSASVLQMETALRATRRGRPGRSAADAASVAPIH